LWLLKFETSLSPLPIKMLRLWLRILLRGRGIFKTAEKDTLTNAETPR